MIVFFSEMSSSVIFSRYNQLTIERFTYTKRLLYIIELYKRYTKPYTIYIY